MVKETNGWKNLPGPQNITRTVTENGITVLSFSNFNTRSVFIVGLIEGGSIYDPKDKLGLAHFTSSMLTRGTEKRGFSAYHHALEERGANLVFSSGARHTAFSGKSLAEDARLLFDLAAEGLLHPAFEKKYVQRLRNQLLASLAIRDQDTSEVASMLLDRLLFGSHPYGEPVDGRADTIANIQRVDLVDFHARTYQPKGMILAAAGAVEAKAIAQMAEEYFAVWEGVSGENPSPPPLPTPPAEIVRRHTHLDEKSQVDLEMGTLGPARTSEDYLPVYLGNNILGQFGLMGRIGSAVRSRAGLAYHASSGVSAWSDSGTWEFSAGLNPDNMEQAEALMRAEIRRFLEEPVSQEELDDSRSHLIGRMPLSLESNAGVANAILTMERFQLGLDYFQQYATRLKAVTAEGILAASRRYLHPDRLAVASAGPGEDIP